MSDSDTSDGHSEAPRSERPPPSGPVRKDRLGDALKANMARRKAQARARRDEGAGRLEEGRDA